MKAVILVLAVLLPLVLCSGPQLLSQTDFDNLLPTENMTLFDYYNSTGYPPYFPFVGLREPFATYNFAQDGFSYAVTSIGGDGLLLPCLSGGNPPFYMEPDSDGYNGGKLLYDFTLGTLPTLFGGQVCSTQNTNCGFTTDVITVVVNNHQVSQFATSASATDCPWFFVEDTFGISTISFANIANTSFVAVTNITLAVAVHSTGYGDPNFVGFQGEKFTFGGLGQQWYNIISSKKLQINALFSSTCQGKRNNIMSALALNINGNKLFINNTQEATLNGEALPSYIAWHSPILVGQSGTEGKIVRPWANWIHIETPELEFVARLHHVGARHGADFDGQNCEDAYFNFDVTDLSRKTFMHGVLGQSAQHSHAVNTLETSHVDQEFQGTEKDYEVSGAWGTDFTFNQYAGPQ